MIKGFARKVVINPGSSLVETNLEKTIRLIPTQGKILKEVFKKILLKRLGLNKHAKKFFGDNDV